MDAKPNYSLERQRIELEIAQFKLNMQSQNFAIAQKQDEIARLNENIKATKVTISELETTLGGISKE